MSSHLRLLCAGTVSVFLLGSNGVWAKPKYGPEGNPHAIPLSRDSGYIQKRGNKPTDFYRVISFAAPQFHPAACGVASAAAVLNAGLSLRPISRETSDDKLVLQPELLEKVKVENWKKRILGGPMGGALSGVRGTDLASLGKILEEALKVYGVSGGKVEVVHVDGEDDAWVNRVRAVLKANENDSHDFLIANFIQGKLTDDADVGHLAPIGAYDEETDRVLVVDPDREYYEPYWVKTTQFVKGMNTLDATVKKKRGYIRVVFPRSPS